MRLLLWSSLACAYRFLGIYEFTLLPIQMLRQMFQKQHYWYSECIRAKEGNNRFIAFQNSAKGRWIKEKTGRRIESKKKQRKRANNWETHSTFAFLSKHIGLYSLISSNLKLFIILKFEFRWGRIYSSHFLLCIWHLR